MRREVEGIHWPLLELFGPDGVWAGVPGGEEPDAAGLVPKAEPCDARCWSLSRFPSPTFSWLPIKISSSPSPKAAAASVGSPSEVDEDKNKDCWWTRATPPRLGRRVGSLGMLGWCLKGKSHRSCSSAGRPGALLKAGLRTSLPSVSTQPKTRGLHGGFQLDNLDKTS